ncbi:MAG: beta strand repeat-containing protein [Luteibaculum sp.]
MSGIKDGWIIQNNGSDVSSATVGTGTSTTAGVYSYGQAAAADRALGFIDDASTSFVVAWEFTNNTGQTLTNVDISYYGEQWRVSAVVGAGHFTTDFAYKIGTGLSGTFTDVNTLDYEAVDCVDNTGGGFLGVNPDGVCDASGAQNGNTNRTLKTAQITLPGAGLADGESIVFRWTLPAVSTGANSPGIGIDDVSFNFFLVEAGVWYLRPGSAGNASAPASWTQYANGTASPATPAEAPGANADVFIGDDETFIVNSNVTMAVSFQNFGISGTNSKLVIAENTSVTLDLGLNDNFGATIELRDNATLTINHEQDPNISGYVQGAETVPAVNFINPGDGSKVIFTSGFASNIPIPGGAYHDIQFTDDNNASYTFPNSITISGSFNYNAANTGGTDDNQIVLSGSPTITFTGGGTTQINFPSYSGANHLPNLIVDAGTTLQFGSILNNAFTHNRTITINGTLELSSNQTLTIPNRSITVGALGEITLNSGADLLCTGTTSITNGGIIDALGDNVISTVSGAVSNSGTLNLGEGTTFTLSSGNFTNSGTTSIAEDAFLTVTAGILNNTGTINIADDGSLVQGASSTLTGTGTFNVTRNKPDGQASNLYNFWSTPVSVETIGDLGASRAYRLNAPGLTTANWASVSGATQMEIGRGYAMTGVSSHTFSGIANNGTIQYATLYDGSGDNNYNALGNPYPSAINAAAFLNANNTKLDGFIRLFNHDPSIAYTVANQQISINFTGSTVAGSTDNSKTLNNTYIASGQGFYACILASGGGGNVSFTNSMRGGDNSDFKSNKSGEKNLLSRFYLQIIDGNTRYNSLMGIVEETSVKYDWGWDAIAPPGGNFYIHPLASDGRPLCITAIPPIEKTTSIPLHVAVSHAGEYQIHIEADEFPDFGDFAPHILDQKTYQITPIDEGDYSFTASKAETWTDRFYLVFARKQISTSILEELASKNEAWVYNQNGGVHVRATKPGVLDKVLVHAIDGKLLKEVKVDNLAELQVLRPQEVSGNLFLIQLNFKNGESAFHKIQL